MRHLPVGENPFARPDMPPGIAVAEQRSGTVQFDKEEQTGIRKATSVSEGNSLATAGTVCGVKAAALPPGFRPARIGILFRRFQNPGSVISNQFRGSSPEVSTQDRDELAPPSPAQIGFFLWSFPPDDSCPKYASIRTTSAWHRIARGAFPAATGNSTSTVRRTPIEGNGIVGNQRSRIPVRLKFCGNKYVCRNDRRRQNLRRPDTAN